MQQLELHCRASGFLRALIALIELGVAKTRPWSAARRLLIEAEVLNRAAPVHW
jgi:hypothetical protein